MAVEEWPVVTTRDLVFLAVGLACFGLCYLYVLACDRLIGRDES